MAKITLQQKWNYQINLLQNEKLVCPVCEEVLEISIENSMGYENKTRLPNEEPFVQLLCNSTCCECDGEGEIECDMGFTHNCPLCDGEEHRGCGWLWEGFLSNAVKEFLQ